MPVRGMLVVQGQIGTCLSSLSSRLECLMPPSINPSPTHMLHTFSLHQSLTHAHAPHLLPHLHTCFTASPTESARGGTQTERERLNNTHTCTYTHTHTHSLTHSLTHTHTEWSTAVAKEAGGAGAENALQPRGP
jgi:hypothetical protein